MSAAQREDGPVEGARLCLCEEGFTEAVYPRRELEKKANIKKQSKDKKNRVTP